MQPCSTPTTRGQARRRRALAGVALQRYDLDVAGPSLITNDFNSVFRVATRSGEKHILRVDMPEGGHTRDHVAATMDWLAALARDGALFVEAGAAGVPEPRLCAVFQWAAGTDLARRLAPANASRLGKLTAELHAHAATYRPSAGLSLLSFDRVFPFPEPIILFKPCYTEPACRSGGRSINRPSRGRRASWTGWPPAAKR